MRTGARRLYARAMTKAYSFIRFSTPAQMKGDSLRRQLAKAERYAADRGLDLDSSYRALGVSAFTGKHRTKGALAAFLNAVRVGEIEAGSWLLVENVDRLSRETPWDAMGLFREIIDSELTVATLMDDMIYDLPTLRSRPEHLQTLNAALTKGHRESADKSERLRDAWSEKRGGLGGRRKLTRQGPRWVDLIPDNPGESLIGGWQFNERAEVIRRIYQMCADGIGKELIARHLNEAGVSPFRGGDGWQASTVLFLLRDRRTIGEFQPHTKVDGVRQPIGDPIPDYFPAVVSEELFYKVQTELARRHTGAHPGKKNRVPNIFVGLARCSCGRAMEFRDKSGRKHKSEKAIYLICSGAQRGHACGHAHHHTYSALENLILEWVTDIRVTDAEANKATLASIKLQAKIAERDDLKRRITEGLAKWEMLTGGVVKDALFASIERNGAALTKVEAAITELESVVRTTNRGVVNDRRAAVAAMRQDMACLDGEALFEARAKLASALRQVIDHVEFQPDGSFRVTLVGGLKLYHFADGQFVGAFDLTEVNPERDKLLLFPSAQLKDSRRWEPMTLTGVRETLEALVGQNS